MYEAFYGLREKPFSLLPDPKYLFFSKRHSMAYSLLQYGLTQQAGFTVIAGDVGSGKTTLIRHLLDNVEGDVTLGVITNTHAAFGDLMRWVALAFNLDFKGKDKVQLVAEFQEFMINEYAKGKRTVLVIDEAQNMAPETLEELRLLSNINADRDLVLQLILVGQPELRTTLRRPDMRQFAQRVSVAYFLKRLTVEETTAYVRHRLRTAGREDELFTQDALETVHKWSGGVPRLINNLCDTALVYGYAEEAERIGRAIINEVARDKGESGIFDDTIFEEENSADEQNRPVDIAAQRPRRM